MTLPNSATDDALVVARLSTGAFPHTIYDAEEKQQDKQQEGAWGEGGGSIPCRLFVG